MRDLLFLERERKVNRLNSLSLRKVLLDANELKKKNQ